MNREIKFRAFQDNEMLISPVNSNYGLQRFFGMLFEDTKFMHYSGLIDKNGQLIYECDIVKSANAYTQEDKGFICKFKDYRWKFSNVRRSDDDFNSIVNYSYIQQNCEIIGNVFEHPQLLQQ